MLSTDARRRNAKEETRRAESRSHVEAVAIAAAGAVTSAKRTGMTPADHDVSRGDSNHATQRSGFDREPGAQLFLRRELTLILALSRHRF
jgi:hypothetical protein